VGKYKAGEAPSCGGWGREGVQSTPKRGSPRGVGSEARAEQRLAPGGARSAPPNPESGLARSAPPNPESGLARSAPPNPETELAQRSPDPNALYSTKLIKSRERMLRAALSEVAASK